jgi:hypothetical protein
MSLSPAALLLVGLERSPRRLGPRSRANIVDLRFLVLDAGTATA